MNLRKRKLNIIEDTETDNESKNDTKKPKHLNFLLFYSILSCAISTLIVEHNFSVVRYKNPLPTPLFYFMWSLYAFIVSCIINLDEKTRGFSIGNIDKFRNSCYGKVSCSKVPNFTPKKTKKLKINNDLIRKVEEKLKTINTNVSLLTVRGKISRKKFFTCSIPNCQKKKGFLYKKCLYSHIILEHESDTIKAKIIFDKMISEIITKNNFEKSKERNILFTKNPQLIQKTVFNLIPEIKNNSNYNLLIYDCETTGFSKNFNGICEVSCYSYLYDTHLTSLFNPNVQGFSCKWNEQAQKINKIDYKKVIDKPLINFFCTDFIKWATNNGEKIPLIYAHNCGFDKRFFDKSLQNFSINNPDFFWLDSIGVFKESSNQKTKKSVSLENLRKDFLVGNNLILHGASNDVLVLKELLIMVFGSLQKKSNIVIKKLIK
jgi:hypothetical protein